jgi:hypothetical protein
VEGGKEREKERDDFFLILFFHVEWLGTGGQISEFGVPK